MILQQKSLLKQKAVHLIGKETRGEEGLAKVLIVSVVL